MKGPFLKLLTLVYFFINFRDLKKNDKINIFLKSDKIEIWFNFFIKKTNNFLYFLCM